MPVTHAAAVPHPPIILPEVGRGQERGVAATIAAYDKAARFIAEAAPDTLVITSPHATMYADYFHISPGDGARGDLSRFGAPEASASVRYDTEFVEALSRRALQEGVPAGTLGEREASLDHGALIPLRFIQRYTTNFKVVRIGLSGLTLLDHYRLGQVISRCADSLGTRVAFVASGDLSHKLKADGPYGFAPEGPVFDEQVTLALANADFSRLLAFDESFCDAAAECGLRSFIAMAGALDGRRVKARLLSHEGTFGVGYAVCLFDVLGEDSSRRFGEQALRQRQDTLSLARREEDAYVRLARVSLETFVREGKRVKRPADLPAAMTRERAGAFVSLKKDGRLRGCIGTIGPATDCVADEILRNAICAGTEDPRFSPVTPQELDALTYSVDILGTPEPAASLDDLDTERYGVIVTLGRRRGLLLPNLDGVNTPEQQVSIALQKAGIDPDAPYTMERFEVVRHT